MRVNEKLYSVILASIFMFLFSIPALSAVSASDVQNATSAVNVERYPYGVVVDPEGTYIYVTNAGSNTVSVIDTATNAVKGTVNVGSAPSGVAVNPMGTKVYVANYNSSSVSVIDTATDTVTATIPVESNPLGVAVSSDGTKVYVTNRGSSSVSVIDTATDTVTATVPVGSNPWGVAVDPVGTNVYVANYDSRSVSVIDTTTNTVSEVLVGSGPLIVSVNLAGTKVYVTNWGNNTVSVIDTATKTVTATVPVGSNPYGVVVSHDGSKVYVTNFYSNTISVIDPATNIVTSTVPAVSSPLGIAINPAGTIVYVTNAGNNTVSVINTVSVPLGTVTRGTVTRGTVTLGGPSNYCLLRAPQYMSDPCPCFQFYLALNTGNAARATSDGITCSVTALGAREGWGVDPTFNGPLSWTEGDEAMKNVSPYFDDSYGCNACRRGNGTVNNGTANNGTAIEPWYVFLANNAMFVDQESVFKSKRTCDISGWGTDCSKTVGDSVQLTKVKGPFNSYEEATKAYCADIVPGTAHSIPLTSGSKAKFNFDGQEHWIDTAPTC
jgi:YVTN family beta-propeller protein